MQVYQVAILNNISSLGCDARNKIKNWIQNPQKRGKRLVTRVKIQFTSEEDIVAELHGFLGESNQYSSLSETGPKRNFAKVRFS